MSEIDRIRWQCRRGMLELDVVLNRFLDSDFRSLDATDVQAFVSLLALPDDMLLDVVMGRTQLSDPALESVAARVRAA